MSKAATKAQITMNQAMKDSEQASKEAAITQKNLNRTITLLSRTRNECRSQSALFDEAESDLNHGFRNWHHQVLSSAAATGALSCETSDRAENERTYLDMARAILDRIQK